MNNEPSPLLQLSPIDCVDDMDKYWNNCYKKLKDSFMQECNNQEESIIAWLQNKMQASQQPHLQIDIYLGLLYSILNHSTTKEQSLQYFKFLNLCIRSDGYTICVNELTRLIQEKYTKLHEICKERLQIILMEWIESNVHDIENCCICLLRYCISNDINTTNNTSQLFSWFEKLYRNKSSWFWNQKNLPYFFIYTWSCVLYDWKLIHGKTYPHPHLLSACQKMCLEICKEKPSSYWVPLIGKDLIRILYLLSTLDQEFTPLFQDCYTYLLANPTLPMKKNNSILIHRITPEMEKQLLFLMNNVKLNHHQRHLSWFSSKHFTPLEHHSDTLIMDLIRYICVVVHLQNYSIPRWIILGWLVKSIKNSQLMDKIILQMMWDYFIPQNGNMFTIEPAISLLINSVKKYVEVSASILHCLVTIVSKEIPQSLTVVQDVFAFLMEKNALQNIEMVLENSQIDSKVRDYVKNSILKKESSPVMVDTVIHEEESIPSLKQKVIHSQQVSTSTTTTSNTTTALELFEPHLSQFIQSTSSTDLCKVLDIFDSTTTTLSTATIHKLCECIIKVILCNVTSQEESLLQQFVTYSQTLIHTLLLYIHNHWQTKDVNNKYSLFLKHACQIEGSFGYRVFCFCITKHPHLMHCILDHCLIEQVLATKSNSSLKWYQEEMNRKEEEEEEDAKNRAKLFFSFYESMILQRRRPNMSAKMIFLKDMEMMLQDNTLFMMTCLPILSKMFTNYVKSIEFVYQLISNLYPEQLQQVMKYQSMGKILLFPCTNMIQLVQWIEESLQWEYYEQVHLFEMMCCELTFYLFKLSDLNEFVEQEDSDEEEEEETEGEDKKLNAETIQKQIDSNVAFDLQELIIKILSSKKWNTISKMNTTILNKLYQFFTQHYQSAEDFTLELLQTLLKLPRDKFGHFSVQFMYYWILSEASAKQDAEPMSINSHYQHVSKLLGSVIKQVIENHNENLDNVIVYMYFLKLELEKQKHYTQPFLSKRSIGQLMKIEKGLSKEERENLGWMLEYLMNKKMDKQQEEEEEEEEEEKSEEEEEVEEIKEEKQKKKKTKNSTPKKNQKGKKKKKEEEPKEEEEEEEIEEEEEEQEEQEELDISDEEETEKPSRKRKSMSKGQQEEDKEEVIAQTRKRKRK